MNNNLVIILVLIYLLVVYLLSKYYKIIQKIKQMQEVMATCTDIVVRRTYNKKYYLYFYTFKIDNDTNNISDKLRLPIMQKKIKIKDTYLMYVNNRNIDDYISPITTLTYKWYLHGAIILIILSFLFFI